MRNCANQKCRNVISPEKDSRTKYCSKSCAAQVNNLGKRRHGEAKLESTCPNCSRVFLYHKKQSTGKFCSVGCSAKYTHETLYQSWVSGERSQNIDRALLRRYLIRLRGNRCAIDDCGVDEVWLGKAIVLVVDHIDGDAGNHHPNNIRLLCPNCNSQTDTFSGRNKGRGRKSRGLSR